jgi:hypothetical protein
VALRLRGDGFARWQVHRRKSLSGLRAFIQLPRSNERRPPQALGRRRALVVQESAVEDARLDPDNRIAVVIKRSGTCESESKSGIFLINPRTLARRFVYPSASAMWNPGRG